MLPFCGLRLRGLKPVDRAYPTELRTLGDPVRKRLLDLGLLQREVALRIGVDKTTVYNWKAGRSASSLKAIAEEIRFLRYDLTETGSKFGEQLRATRRRRGLSRREVAEQLGVDPSAIPDLEKGRHVSTTNRGFVLKSDESWD